MVVVNSTEQFGPCDRAGSPIEWNQILVVIIIIIFSFVHKSWKFSWLKCQRELKFLMLISDLKDKDIIDVIIS